MAVGNEAASQKPASMEGGGFYNRHSAMQAAGIDLLLPLWETVCRAVPATSGLPVIVDYGCSQGRNSMVPLRVAIEQLRTRIGPEVPIEVVHTDLPSNDFSTLFEALQDPSVSYMAGLEGIFPSAIGRSYFEPIVSPGRVLLGWNSWTMQWMSRSPAEAPDHVIAGMSRETDVRRAADAQLAADWSRFLELRAAELCQGGKLLTAFVGRTAQGTGWEWLLGELWAAVLDLGAAGSLSPDEQRRVTIPVSPRRLGDIEAPFARGRRFAGLRLERAEIVTAPDPFWQAFRQSGDARELGRRHADTTRAWAGPSIADRIGPDKVDALFGRLAARVAANPQKHEPYLAVVVLAKE